MLPGWNSIAQYVYCFYFCCGLFFKLIHDSVGCHYSICLHVYQSVSQLVKMVALVDPWAFLSRPRFCSWGAQLSTSWERALTHRHTQTHFPQDQRPALPLTEYETGKLDLEFVPKCYKTPRLVSKERMQLLKPCPLALSYKCITIVKIKTLQSIITSTCLESYFLRVTWQL